MNKLACGIAALGLMAGSTFADYDIIKLGEGVVNNPKTAYGDYIAVYGTGELSPGNATDEHGFVAFENGYAVIKSIAQKGTDAPADWNAVALSIKNTAENSIPNMGDCSGGFSYSYKGNAPHKFELAFDPALCNGTNPDEGSNKWGKNNLSASSTAWVTQTITKTELETNGLINTWAGENPSKCQTATKPTLDLKKVLQMSWVIDGGTAAIGKTLTIGTVTCIGGTLPSSSSVAATPSSSSVTGASSSSGGAGTSSSSGGAGASSSSGGAGTSSSSEDPEPIISHSNAPVIGLNVAHFARSLRVASGEDATVSLFDIRGKQILSQRVLSGTTTISLEKQKQGVYYAVAKSGSQKQIVKIVLK